MKNHSINGHPLEVTVVCCNNLKDTEWISKQDPYVPVEYGSKRKSTRVCKDGDKNPMFQEKFVFSLKEGLREINVSVYNCNTVLRDDFIGKGRVQLANVLHYGYEDSSWPLQTKSCRAAGQNPANSYVQSAPLYGPSSEPYSSLHAAWPSSAPYSSMYYAPPPASVTQYPPTSTGAYSVPSPFSYTPNVTSYPTLAYPLNSGVNPTAYPPNAGVYRPSPYPPQATHPPRP